MCFWLILFCLTLILNNGVMETPNFVFDYTPLGHSVVLIYWKSNTSLNENDYSRRDFVFAKRAKAINGSFAAFELEDGNYEQFSKRILTEQIKIRSLEEDTPYKIIIRERFYERGDPSPKFGARFPPLMIKTNRRTNTTTKPAKPDFRYEYNPNEFLFTGLRIYWLPCGKERDCRGNEAGTHFALKFRPLDRRGDYKFETDADSYIDFICLIGGIQYEVIVISINGNYETESDSQEILIRPRFSAVTSVKVVSFLNGSVSISWKPPKYAIETLEGYFAGIINDSAVNHNPAPIYDLSTDFYRSDSMKNVHIVDTGKTEKLFDKQAYQLKPGDTYTFFIIPRGPHFAGLETRVKYTIPRNKDDL